MGIDIASMVHVTRQGLARRPDTGRPARRRAGTGQPRDGIRCRTRPAAGRPLKSCARKGTRCRSTRTKADILVLTSTIDVLLFKDALEATVKVMNHLGLDWTIHSCAFEGANFGLLSGYPRSRSLPPNASPARRSHWAPMVIVPECGHAYPALRWEGANAHGARCRSRSWRFPSFSAAKSWPGACI